MGGAGSQNDLAHKLNLAHYMSYTKDDNEILINGLGAHHGFNDFASCTNTYATKINFF